MQAEAFDAIMFDVYGTLIDWEPEIAAFLTGWVARSGIDMPAVQALALFDGARASLQKQRPALLYPEILRRALDTVAAAIGLSAAPADRDAFAATPGTWPAFADSVTALAALRERFTLVAVSNIDEASLVLSRAKLGEPFEVIVTAERVGAYKPDLPHFETALADLAARGIPRERVLHVGQSLRADIGPANRLGLPSVWVNRPGRGLGNTGEGVAGARPDVEVPTMAALAAHLLGTVDAAATPSTANRR